MTFFLQGLDSPLGWAFRNRKKGDHTVLTLTCMLCLSFGIFYFDICLNVVEEKLSPRITLIISSEL